MTVYTDAIHSPESKTAGIRRTPYRGFGFETVTIWEATADDAAFAVMAFQAENPFSDFGPVVLSVTGVWIAHGKAET